MKTGLDMLQDISNLLMLQHIKDFISGDLCIMNRTNNSDLEDIVLGSLGINQEQVQSGVFNINIHVPNLVLEMENGRIDNSQPNFARMMEITNIVIPMVQDKRTEDYWLTIAMPAIPLRDQDGTFFSGIRVNYNSVNKNFK